MRWIRIARTRWTKQRTTSSFPRQVGSNELLAFNSIRWILTEAASLSKWRMIGQRPHLLTKRKPGQAKKKRHQDKAASIKNELRVNKGKVAEIERCDTDDAHIHTQHPRQIRSLKRTKRVGLEFLTWRTRATNSRFCSKARRKDECRVST